MSIDKKYKDYTKTPRQLEIINAVISEGSFAKAAAKLQCAKGTVGDAIARIKLYAADAGFDPDNNLDHPVPRGAAISSLNYDGDGNIRSYWVKSQTEDTPDMIEVLIEKSKGFKPAKNIKGPKHSEEDLLNLYTISDYHLGMLCWARETNDDWDLETATELLLQAFLEMINRSPKASHCIINQLGDFLHTDSLIPITPASGNILDTDTRYYKMVETGLYLMRQMIELAAKRHEKVTVICAEGNHDPSSTPWLQICLDAIYENNERIDIIKDPKVYQAYDFGKNMLCFHHGHKKHKPSDLQRIFSSDPFFREMWGRSKYASCHTGHFHYEKVEDGGMVCTQHPTLTARNAYEARSGYGSQRACISFTYSKQYGEHSSVYVKPEMFE